MTLWIVLGSLASIVCAVVAVLAFAITLPGLWVKHRDMATQMGMYKGIGYRHCIVCRIVHIATRLRH